MAARRDGGEYCLAGEAGSGAMAPAEGDRMTSAMKRNLGWLGRWGTAAMLAAGAALTVRAWAADAAPAPAGAVSADAEKVKFFEEQVRPILQNNCVKCHGGEKTKGGLKVTTRDDVLKGGEQGPAVKADAPDASLI